jgi:hypothetical protein
MSEPTRMTAESGGSKDLKIERYDQIPPSPLAELAARYGVGNLKYKDKDGLNNWHWGYPWSWSYRALIGHANAFWAGEDVDEATYVGTDNESPYDENGDPRPGVMHLAAVAWHAFALLEWMETFPENDDRVSTIKARLTAGLSPVEDMQPYADPERIEEIQDEINKIAKKNKIQQAIAAGIVTYGVGDGVIGEFAPEIDDPTSLIPRPSRPAHYRAGHVLPISAKVRYRSTPEAELTDATVVGWKAAMYADNHNGLNGYTLADARGLVPGEFTIHQLYPPA